MSVFLLPEGTEPLARDGDVLTFAGPAGVGRVLSVQAFLARELDLPRPAVESDGAS